MKNPFPVILYNLVPYKLWCNTRSILFGGPIYWGYLILGALRMALNQLIWNHIWSPAVTPQAFSSLTFLIMCMNSWRHLALQLSLVLMGLPQNGRYLKIRMFMGRSLCPVLSFSGPNFDLRQTHSMQGCFAVRHRYYSRYEYKLITSVSEQYVDCRFGKDWTPKWGL